MKFYQKQLIIYTLQRGTIEITNRINNIVKDSAIQQGLCHIFLMHTSASLILCENADPAVQKDLAAFFSRLVPDGDTLYTHTAEGPDDVSAHLRSILTRNDITLPITQGELLLGTWQGLFLWEHRTSPHSRHLIITVQG